MEEEEDTKFPSDRIENSNADEISQNINTTEQFTRGRSPILSPVSSASHIRRRSRSSSRAPISEEQTLSISRTTTHPLSQRPSPSNPRLNSSEFLLQELDYETRERERGGLIKIPSFLNRRRTTSSGNDLVEMSSVRRDSLINDSELNQEQEAEFENLDDSDTAQLTAPIASEEDEPNRRTSSFIEPQSPSLSPNQNIIGLDVMSKMLKRVSSRVVNLHNVPREILQKNDMSRYATIEPPIRTSSRKSMSQKREQNVNKSTPIILQQKSPLLGWSLFIFGPNNYLRLWLYDLLNHPWTESIILFLIFANVALLSAQAWNPLPYGTRQTNWMNDWTDYGLLVIFIIFTLEMIARIIVSGFIINSRPTLQKVASLTDDTQGLPSYLHPQVKKTKESPLITPTKVWEGGSPTPQSNAARSMADSAFLRHSFNRIDLMAIVSFWIDLVLTFSGVHHFYIFKALATMRSLRLLSITSGSSTILQSLKKSAPLLVNVAFFVFFFFAIFSIIGVQSFKGSFKRRCVWIDPTNSADTYTISPQFCGGYINENGTKSSYQKYNLQISPEYPKGYICPQGQVCMEVGNPKNGTVNFDNVFTSLVLVFVISSVQNWSDLMYKAMDSDFDWACLFFIAAVVILNFWIINLFVAVITEMFAKIRHDNAHSAFTLSKTTPILLDDAEGWILHEGDKTKKPNALNRFMDEIKYIWVMAIVIDILIMGFRGFDMDQFGLAVLSNAELVFTLIFALEIILRLGAFHPDYSLFFNTKRNVVDLTLAVITCIIQIPLIKSSPAYPYLTVFQIARVYRVIIAWPRMRKLFMRVLGSAYGLINLIFFIVLVNFIAAVIGVQLIRGDIPDTDDQGNTVEMRFNDMFNSFVALYQLFSGENWTDILYNVMSYERALHSTVISTLFLLVWFSLSNFVLLNMFIAVVQENFETAEEEKLKYQVKAFLRKVSPKEKQEDIIESWNIYRFLKPKPKSLAVENIPSSLILSTQKSRIRDFLNDDGMGMENKNFHDYVDKPGTGLLGRLKRFLRRDGEDEHILLESYETRRHSSQFDDSAGIPGTNDTAMGEILNDRPTEAVLDDFQERRAMKVDFIAAHPNYNESLWFLSPRSRLRHYCQLLVPPSYGERIHGTAPSPTLSLLFSIFIFLCIVANVVVAAIVNPMYQKAYFARNGMTKLFTWFWITDTAFTGVFTIELLIKVIADGFLFTPNAYLLNVWNVLDFFVLGTLYINIFSTITNATGVSRAVRAFKALRALRLINLSASIKETFYAILIAGAPRILDASILSLSLFIPFAIYGQNIFSGLLYSCNDGSNSINFKTDCVGEYQSSPYLWNVLAPRAWTNPYVWSFDSFSSGILILFEIASGEGWIDVMKSVMMITGRDQQPQLDNQQWNALFFMIFNMAGAVFVLTLFISVIIENYQTRSGAAFLTSDQRRWIDLKKLLKQTKPSKRPKSRPKNKIRALCYDLVIDKKGWLPRFMTCIYILHILNLMTESADSPAWLDTFRSYAFLGFTLIYIIEICIKLAAFGWTVFRANRWNLYDLFVVSGAALTRIPLQSGLDPVGALAQLQKLFLVAIAFKLIQKSNSLNQLFKTMAASLPSIFNLFAVWFVVFCAYAIMFMEAFGLTKFGSQASKHVNFRNFPNSFVTLVRMSTGEGWNTVMHDYTVEAPLCVDSTNYLGSDCGSTAWAFFLFISWNVLSMYIFANMFIVVVIDNFSYCYQIAAKFSLVNREEMRKFKKAWGEVDVDRTGYIKSQDFAKFFGKLSGSFEVKIYEDSYRIPNLIKNSVKQNGVTNMGLWGSTKQRGNLVAGDIDIRLLEQNLAQINPNKTRERRRIYNLLYQEALLSVERDRNNDEKGMSFTNMLLMLAHYKLIEDDTSLRIEELLERKEKMERVVDNVNRDRVRSILRTILRHRRYKARKNEKLRVGSAEIVPRITVDDSDSHQRLRIDVNQLSHIGLNPSQNSPNSPSSPITPLSGTSDHNESLTSPSRASSRALDDLVESQNRSGRWSSTDANDETDDQAASNALNTLQNSFWHDMLQEVIEENSQSNPQSNQ